MGQIEVDTERGFFRRLRNGLAKTRSQLSAGVGNLLLGKKEIDDAMLDELETALLLADVGVEATSHIMEALSARVKRKQLNDSTALHKALRTELIQLLQPIAHPLVPPGDRRPFVILVVGVNGGGEDHDDRQAGTALQIGR